jgi:hypothetical protein
VDFMCDFPRVTAPNPLPSPIIARS